MVKRHLQILFILFLLLCGNVFAQFENEFIQPDVEFVRKPDPPAIPLQKSECTVEKSLDMISVENCYLNNDKKGCQNVATNQISVSPVAASLPLMAGAMFSLPHEPAEVDEYHRLKKFEYLKKYSIWMAQRYKIFLSESKINAEQKFRDRLRLVDPTITDIQPNMDEDPDKFLERLHRENTKLISTKKNKLSLETIRQEMARKELDLMMADEDEDMVKFHKKMKQFNIDLKYNPFQTKNIYPELEQARSEYLREQLPKVLGAKLVARVEEATRVLNQERERTIKRADPNFENDIKEIQKKNSPELVLRRLELFQQRVRGPLQELGLQFQEKYPILDGYLNLSVKKFGLENLITALEQDLYKRGITASASFDETSRVLSFENLPSKAIAAFAILSPLGASAATFVTSKKLRGCARDLELSNQEMELLLRANPKIGYLDRCEDLKLEFMEPLLRQSFIEFGYIPNGICKLAVEKTKSMKATLAEIPKESGCNRISIQGASIEDTKGTVEFNCESSFVEGLKYTTKLDSDGEIDIEGFKSNIKGHDHPMPALQLKQSLRTPITRIGQSESLPLFSSGSFIESEQKRLQARTQVGNFSLACDRYKKENPKDRPAFENCKCAKGAIALTSAWKSLKSGPKCQNSIHLPPATVPARK